MTHDEIIKLAREAQAPLIHDNKLPEWAKRFAALVAAAEREACAKLVEPSSEHRADASWAYLGGDEGVELLDAKAAAIRARATR